MYNINPTRSHEHMLVGCTRSTRFMCNIYCYVNEDIQYTHENCFSLGQINHYFNYTGNK